MIETKNLEQIQNSITNGETCVVNVTAMWCSDCTDQAHNLESFSEILASYKVPCYGIAVQQEKHVYLSPAHQSFTEQLGGHGFPRTVLIINGKIIDAGNVEIITELQLSDLAAQFIKQLS